MRQCSAKFTAGQAGSGTHFPEARISRFLRPGLAVSLVLLCAGCTHTSGDARTGNDSDADQVARTEIERGPVRASIEIEPKAPRLSDEPELTLTIDHEDGVSIVKPPFGESLGDFAIRNFREPLPVIRGKRRIVTMIYTLEPMRAGELTVAPVAISFTDSRADGDGREHTIETEALTLTVTTVLDAEAPTLDDLRGSSGPLEIPRQLGGALWWIATTAAVVAGIAGFAWWRFRRRLVIATPELTPRERAFLELQQLIDARLAETDIKGYYVALTGVVRRYIERTTLVRAPEQTTDEFLREIADHPAFTLDERRRLQSFLLAADLVKYAAHEPSGQDLEQSFERAKEFLGLSSHASTEAAA